MITIGFTGEALKILERMRKSLNADTYEQTISVAMRILNAAEERKKEGKILHFLWTEDGEVYAVPILYGVHNHPVDVPGDGKISLN